MHYTLDLAAVFTLVSVYRVISRRRNELLREMYHMMQRRENAGAFSIFDDEEDEDGLHDWLEKYDINKKFVALFTDSLPDMLILTSPDSGMVSNIPESELCATSSYPNHDESKLITNETQEVIDADSPMSEPPASPRSEVSVQLDVPESDSPFAASKPEGTPPSATPMSGKHLTPDVEPDELNLVDLSHSPSLRSISHRSQSLTHRTSRSKSRTFSPPTEPLITSLDKVREVAESLVEEQMDVTMDVPMQEDREPSPDLILPSSSPVMEKQKSPLRTIVHTTVDVTTIQPSLLIPTPTSPAADPAFSFDEAEIEPHEEALPDADTSIDAQRHHHFNPAYTLPPLRSLPPEYLRKGKSVKQKKRDKERDKADGKNKDEWTPMGLTKWGATVRANPVWKKVSRATKCLSTRDWGVCNIVLSQLKCS